jgi:preprotein translocase subunit SecA
LYSKIVVQVPTDKAIQRIDEPDKVFRSVDEKNFPVAVIPENDSKSLNKFWKVIVAITLLSVETSIPYKYQLIKRFNVSMNQIKCFVQLMRKTSQ